MRTCAPDQTNRFCRCDDLNLMLSDAEHTSKTQTCCTHDNREKINLQVRATSAKNGACVARGHHPNCARKLIARLHQTTSMGSGAQRASQRCEQQSSQNHADGHQPTAVTSKTLRGFGPKVRMGLQTRWRVTTKAVNSIKSA